jgi:hydroxymethylglutaryl-CoA lyase
MLSPNVGSAKSREGFAMTPNTAAVGRPLVIVVEVAPRDGFQSIGPIISTERKIAVIEAADRAGATRIEVGSFVRPSALPEMGDIRRVLAGLSGKTLAELSVLVPNLKGAMLACEVGIMALVYVVSASPSHNRANVRREIDESMNEFRSVVETVGRLGRLRFNIATAFDCPFEGTTDLTSVLRLVERALSINPHAEICLCDTTGKATPAQVAAAFSKCLEHFGPQIPLAYHAHDTYGLGLASSWAAYQANVRIFDAALAGLGGCPFAPNASGNIATEDLVYMFESTGIETGYDFGDLVDAAELAAQIEGGQPGGHIRAIMKKARRHVSQTG